MTATRTSHPHIQVRRRRRGPTAVVRGTRTRVAWIALRHEYLGESVDEIVEAWPHLNLAQVHDALSYYHDHQQALDREIKQEEALVAELQAFSASRG